MCSQVQVIGGIDYCKPVKFDDITPERFKTPGSIPYFTRMAVLDDARNNFEALERDPWDAAFARVFRMDSLPSSVWQDIIAVDASHLSFLSAP